MKIYALLAALVLGCGLAYAETMNPASNAIADSDNTASTIVLRNSSGNFSAGTITATITGNITGNVTGNVAPVSAVTSYVGLPVVSSTSLQTATFVQAGLAYWIKNAAGALVGQCVSSGTAISSIVLSSQTAQHCAY